ncbi:MAG: hemolysin family protein [Actinobacteria bacterium]|nr:hemolysin family protein [Actinomycetota bacterium]
MTGIDIVAVVAVTVMLLLTAMVGAFETVVSQLDVVRALRLDEEERPGSDRLLWLIEHRGRTLNVVLFLTVTLRVTAAAVLIALLSRHLAGASGIAIAVAVMVLASYVAAEVLPRTLALRHLEASGLVLGRLFHPVVRGLRPLVEPLTVVGRALVRERNGVAGPFPGEDELDDRDDDGEDEPIEPEERAMIHSIFELGDTIAREIMVPRPDMVTLGEDASFEDVLETIIGRGYSRIPVTGENRDEIVGIVYAKDVLERLSSDLEGREWGDLVRPATFVPETKRGDDLLRELQEQKVHLAIVVDEYGATIGLVTIEDILEEIVGEIVDEHDREEPLVEMLDDGRARVDARLPVDDLNDLFDAELPDDDWDTVGGLLFGTLGRVARPGDRVTIEGLRLIAERVQGRRVSKVVVERVHDDERIPAVEA